MGRVPAFLLGHRATVRPYLSWAVYGPPRILRCFVRAALASPGQAGTERTAQYTVIFFPDANVPAGSLITLPGGIDGFVSASIVHDGGGLPTPDHVETAVTVGQVTGPAAGETVTILHRTRVWDAAGAARWSTASTVIEGCGVRPVTTTEGKEGTATLGADTIEIIVPAGTAVTGGDMVRVRGVLFDVHGNPEALAATVPGVTPGLRLIAARRR